jgi:hypothetical protein
MAQPPCFIDTGGIPPLPPAPPLPARPPLPAAPPVPPIPAAPVETGASAVQTSAVHSDTITSASHVVWQ